MTTLLTARSVRALAAELDLRPTKQRGQNFVIDPNTVRMIVAEAQLPPGAPVAEVGPGLGSLTLGLLEAGHPVVAVEIDPLLAGRLPRTIAELHGGSEQAGAVFELVNADAMRVDALPLSPRALVANLPYNVAVPVLLHFLAAFPGIETVLVMVQAEVADRLAAQPGSRTYGVPSVKAQWYGTVARGSDIGRNVFWPAPNVGSGLVRIRRRAVPLEETAGVGRAEVFAVVDAAFAQRRKTLRAALAGWAGGAEAAGRVLEAAGIDPRARGEVIDIDGYCAIARAARSLGVGPGEPGARGRRASAADAQVSGEAAR
ncbi:16S rRNA (adenine(1518)-N(6)/adenine(1519)-N(6))-dimethyltransferase RsmA [Brevibacterium sp. 5221]|uniref:Ribosomal RNA small subunit methyltransferase A n=1 Tax=Brevibacterium rongguiense TaxID=2695267 RepID=A0A6N9H444_9MICO|nr:16S rRNA (adenine(1518)-N(6)/adenine(1519)-N(6))-dimethyltransferase RsmA [Brevibacterium rongguiense]MYM18693.1 16S rRNA (adenine(1518)-N(6)/adenine(1519)-N(6))-dimethyltransferase RsmA [Brevibacterium rongguiense]